jgi:methyl-accepting chemotaxis protein
MGTGLLTALIMSLVGYLGTARMADAVQDNDVGMTALRNLMEADMMHDAIGQRHHSHHRRAEPGQQ